MVKKDKRTISAQKTGKMPSTNPNANNYRSSEDKKNPAVFPRPFQTCLGLPPDFVPVPIIHPNKHGYLNIPLDFVYEIK